MSDDSTDKEHNEANRRGYPDHRNVDADQQSERARGFENAERCHPRLRHTRFGHGDADLVIADKVARSREDISSRGQDRNNEIDSKHWELRSLFRGIDGGDSSRQRESRSDEPDKSGKSRQRNKKERLRNHHAENAQFPDKREGQTECDQPFREKFEECSWDAHSRNQKT